MATKLRFAAFIRVSTEQQEAQGESLRTQRTEIQRCVAGLGGEVVEWYGGQEHATPGHEKANFMMLLSDASDGKFDAVIVTHQDRWSRSDKDASFGYGVLRQNGIRFFVGSTEFDFHSPDHQLILGIHSVIGKFSASTQNKKSIENRIHRAKRGLPVVGKMPFGRIWDRKTETWSLDPVKHAMIQDFARRYLAGESMAKLAAEAGVNHTSLHKTLTKRCGSQWEQRFDSDDFNIHETVTITIPPLLDDATIAAIRQRAKANKTYLHGRPKYEYLLSGMVFCAECGYLLMGQTNHKKTRYYRHSSNKRVRECPCQPRPYVPAEELEREVVGLLFAELGNPAGVQRAIERTIPNQAKVAADRRRLETLDATLRDIEAGRQRILKLVARDKITDEDADPQLDELRQRETQVREEQATINARLFNIPTTEDARGAATAYMNELGAFVYPNGEVYGNATLNARVRVANRLEAMTYADKRALVERVFGQPQPNGKPAGIYVSAIPGQVNHRRKRYRIELRGTVGVNGLKCVVQNARHCTEPVPRRPRFSARSLRSWA